VSDNTDQVFQRRVKQRCTWVFARVIRELAKCRDEFGETVIRFQSTCTKRVNDSFAVADVVASRSADQRPERFCEFKVIGRRIELPLEFRYLGVPCVVRLSCHTLVRTTDLLMTSCRLAMLSFAINDTSKQHAGLVLIRQSLNDYRRPTISGHFSGLLVSTCGRGIEVRKCARKLLSKYSSRI